MAASASGVQQQGEGGRDTPSVDVRPEGTRPDDPNAGQWFVGTAKPGETLQFRARLTNPARVSQSVSLSLADLDFAEDGTPSIAPRSDDIGTWGTPDARSVTLEPGGRVVTGFSITVPAQAEPGDHVGAFVAESTPQGEGQLRVIKQVATRVYVTVPGDARPEVEIVDIDIDIGGGPVGREARVVVTVRNTGNIRLSPVVLVNGKVAEGPPLLVTRSTEPYSVSVDVPLWAGPLSFKAEVDTEVSGIAGPSDSRTERVWVWPLLMLFALLVALPLVALGALAWRRRQLESQAERTRLEAEVERLSGRNPPSDAASR